MTPPRRPDGRLRLRPWKAGDEAAFAPRPDMATEFATSGHDWDRGAPGPTWTLYRWTGEVAGIGGAASDPTRVREWWMWSVVAEGWRPRDWAQALWLASRVCDTMIRVHSAKKLHAWASLEARGAVGLLQRLEFEPSGLPVTRDGRRYLPLWRRGLP